MTREEFEILMNDYSVPIEAAERFTVEEKDATDWKAKYEAVKSEFDAAKNSYLDKIFGTKEEPKIEEEEEKEYFVEEEREV